MANSDGGVIIYGIIEESHPPSGVDEGIAHASIYPTITPPQVAASWIRRGLRRGLRHDPLERWVRNEYFSAGIASASERNSPSASLSGAPTLSAMLFGTFFGCASAGAAHRIRAAALAVVAGTRGTGGAQGKSATAAYTAT
jgi:hypothetical protein